MQQASYGLRSAESLHSSIAFQTAMLRSEVRRAVAVIAAVGVLVVFMLLRNHSELSYSLQLTAFGGLFTLLALQIIVLAYARKAHLQNCGMPLWFVTSTVIVEGLIPTAMMAAHITFSVLPPYAALSAPTNYVFGVLISLTTLRLRPMLCVLSGAVVAGGNLALLSYVTFGWSLEVPSTGLPRAAYLSIPMLMFMSGLAAAWVARELRANIGLALRELETRRAMDRIEQDLKVARSIQQALLPKSTPQIAGFDIAGWNQPADQTGGDYYDWQRLPDGNWIVTVADVSGHGIGPALVTAACRAYVRAGGLQEGDLGALTTRVNRLLADDLPEGRFVTMATALIRPVDSQVTLLSAGQGPIALYVRAAGNVRDIMPQGLPLAILSDANFGPGDVIEMMSGDVLALVTDGFVEWPREGANGESEQFGVERLRESLRKNAHRSAEEIIREITTEVSTFAGPNPQQDDLTIAIIKRVAG